MKGGGIGAGDRGTGGLRSWGEGGGLFLRSRPVLGAPGSLLLTELPSGPHLFREVLLSRVIQCPSPALYFYSRWFAKNTAGLRPQPSDALCLQDPEQLKSELCFTPVKNEDGDTKPRKVAEEF